MGEMVIILLIVLVLFGAKRIPEISASFGKGIREFKKNINDVQESVTGPETPRHDARLPSGDALARREPATPDETTRPEPKRLF
jgi:sec-independent protein translocase protein TatA